MNILFNCLIYKNNDITNDMILNIKKFVKNPIIILHVNTCFEDFDFDRFDKIENVYINPVRMSHAQYDTKTIAIFSNHELAISLGLDFDYEIIFYPKMLFIKAGIEDYLIGSDLCMPSPTAEQRDLMEYALNTKMNVFTEEEKDFFKNDLEKFLVEGMCFSRSLSHMMYGLIKEKNLYRKNGHCYEEFIFPTVAKYFSINTKNYPGVISYWNFSAIDLMMILNKDILHYSSFFSNNQDVNDIYFIHKVEYNYDDEIREVVRGL